jgi:1-acyl-sn-glycerol-3-phosphate acyltransferase
MPDEQEPIQVEMPPARASDRMRPWWHFWRIFARCLYTVAFHGRVLGRENIPRQGGVLLVSNHQSFFDPFLASLAFDRECNFMARDSLFVIPGLKQLILSLNAFPVRRNTADLRAIKETLRRLKMGQMVLVFPEGTRTSDGRIGKLQPGVAAVAKQAKVAVVPMLIEGAFDVWSRHALLPRPAKVVVRYAPPITPEEVAAMTKEALLERIDRTLRRMQAEVRRIYHWPAIRERQGDRSLQRFAS